MAVMVGTLLPVVVSLVYGTLQDSDIQFNNKSVSDLLSFSGPDAAAKGLFARHFFVMPLFLMALAGQSIAGERVGHMLRERAVRPVSRDRLFFAKLLSLWALSTASLLGGALTSLLITTPWLGPSGPWLSFVGSVGLSVLTDLGIIAVAFLIATWVRSSMMVVVSGLLLLGLDGVLRLGLSGLGVLGVSWAPTAHQIMWGSGLGVWSNLGSNWSWMSFGALIVWTLVALLQARFRLCRLDLP
jgi:ABC-type transport system involved in multi-copper enzyme maturation permease subunit